MSNVSQTQLANFAVFGGLLVIILGKFGVVVSGDEVTFVIASLWSLGWTAYNYYQRFKKGDLTIVGGRK